MTSADLIRKYLMFWIKAILQECGEGFFTCSEWSPVINDGAWSSGVSVALEARTSLGSSISRLSSKAGEALFPEQAGSTEEGFVCQLPKGATPKCLSGASTRKGLIKQRSPTWALAAAVHTGVDPPYCVRSSCSDLKRRIGVFLCSVLTSSHTM